jgi:hypothetical protein
MNVGMLWLDDNRTHAVLDRIGQAAAYYTKKYGRPPTLCMMNPATAGGDLPSKHAGVVLRTSPGVLREHFWIGVEEGSAG